MTITLTFEPRLHDNLKFEVNPENSRVWITQENEDLNDPYYAECTIEDLEKLCNDLNRMIEVSKSLQNG